MIISRKTIAKGTIYSLVPTILSQLIAIFILPLFIKNIGVDLYGIWVISNLLLGYVGILDFGFSQGIQRELVKALQSKNSDHLISAISTGLIIFILVGFVIGLCLIFTKEFIVHFFNIAPDQKEIAIRLILISGMLSFITWPLKIFEAIYNAFLLLKPYNIIISFTSLFNSVLLLALVLVSLNLVTIKLVYSISIGLSGFVPMIFLRKYFRSFKIDFRTVSANMIREMANFSSGVFISQLMGLVSHKIDPILIGRLQDVAGISYYNIATKFFSVISLISSKLVSIVIPVTYNLNANNDKKKIQSLLDQATRYRIIITCVLTYPLMFYSKNIIKIWIGADFIDLSLWASLICIVPILSSLGVAPNMAIAMGYSRKINKITAIRIVLNITISIILIPKIGMGGAILGTLISNLFLGNLVFLPLFARYIGCKWKALYINFIRINLFFLVMGGIMFRIGLYIYNMNDFLQVFVIAISTMILVFLTMVFVLNSRERDDIRNFKKYL